MVAQGIEVDLRRRRRRRLGSRGPPLGGGLHPKPTVLGENGHDAGDASHRIGEERARARVGGTAVLLLAHLVTGAVDLSGEAHGEAVAALDGFLEQQGAHDARARADEVEREADEAEPVRRFAQGVAAGAVRDGDQLRLDTCDERALVA